MRRKQRLTGQTEAGLVEVAYGLVRDVLLLLLLSDGGGLLGGHRRHHLRGQDHVADRPVVLASGDASQLRQLEGGKIRPDFQYPFLLWLDTTMAGHEDMWTSPPVNSPD